MNAEQWNGAHLVGVPVLYRPVKGRAEATYTKTRSAAWGLPSGEAVVNVLGITGGVALDHLTVWDEVAEVDKTTTQRLARLESWLHSRSAHPDYEYETTDGPRKDWDDSATPPDGEGWESNGDNAGGWERWCYHEESHWRRRRPREDGAP